MKFLLRNKYVFGLVASLAVLGAYVDVFVGTCGFKWH